MGGRGSRHIEQHIERANINLNIFKYREKFQINKDDNNENNIIFILLFILFTFIIINYKWKKKDIRIILYNKS